MCVRETAAKQASVGPGESYASTGGERRPRTRNGFGEGQLRPNGEDRV
jgi:hypothetical protein